jgi:hypothetical protein
MKHFPVLIRLLSLFLLLSLFWASPVVMAVETAQTDYEAWLTGFLTKMNDLPLTPGPSDWNDLNVYLTLKPTQETGQYYAVWFRNCFLPFLNEMGPFLDHNKAERLRYLLAARTEKADTSEFFQEYFQELLVFIDKILPILDESEKVLLAAFKEVAPETSSADLALWLNTMSTLKEEYGPDFSEAENLILKVLGELQPSNRPAVSAKISVPVSTLIKMKQLISTGKPHLAIQEIDTLLSGK